MKSRHAAHVELVALCDCYHDLQGNVRLVRIMHCRHSITGISAFGLRLRVAATGR